MTELLILAASLCWAAGMVMIRDLAIRASVLPINAARALAPGLAFPLAALATGHGDDILRIPVPNLLAVVAGVSLGIVSGDLLVLLAIRRIGVARAYALANTYPLVGVLIAVALRGETLGGLGLAGVFLVVGGGTLLSIEPAARGGAARPGGARRWRVSLGAALALFTALLWGVEVNLTKFAVTGVDPIALNSIRMPLGAAALNLGALAVYRRPAPMTLGWRGSVRAFAAGLIALTLGSGLYLYGLQLLGAARAVSLSAASPVFALLLSAGLLREAPGRLSVAGVFLTAGGVALITLS